MKQTAYVVRDIEWIDLNNDNFLSETYGTLLGTGESWLASLCVGARANEADFKTHIASSNIIGSDIQYARSGSYWDCNDIESCNAWSYGVRPLVSLSSSKLKIKDGDGTEASPWTLEKK